jgi:hypothetical protein
MTPPKARNTPVVGRLVGYGRVDVRKLLDRLLSTRHRPCALSELSVISRHYAGPNEGQSYA